MEFSVANEGIHIHLGATETRSSCLFLIDAPVVPVEESNSLLHFTRLHKLLGSFNVDLDFVLHVWRESLMFGGTMNSATIATVAIVRKSVQI